MRTNNVEAKNPSALAVQSSERKWRRRPLLGAVIPVRIICTMAGSSRWTRPGWLAMTDTVPYYGKTRTEITKIAKSGPLLAVMSTSSSEGEDAAPVPDAGLIGGRNRAEQTSALN